MPYIKQYRRREIMPQIWEYKKEELKVAGDLNWLMTYHVKYGEFSDEVKLADKLYSICIDFFSQHAKKYQDINNVMGALICAKKEYKRRSRPYKDTSVPVKAYDLVMDKFYKLHADGLEDDKILENGDV